MNEQEKSAYKIEQKRRTQKRREIKSELSYLRQKNDDFFKLWAYQKSLDEVFLRKRARETLLEIEKLEAIYDRV